MEPTLKREHHMTTKCCMTIGLSKKLHHGPFFQPYVENRLNFDKMIMMHALYKTNMLNWVFIVLAH